MINVIATDRENLLWINRGQKLDLIKRIRTYLTASRAWPTRNQGVDFFYCRRAASDDLEGIVRVEQPLSRLAPGSLHCASQLRKIAHHIGERNAQFLLIGSFCLELRQFHPSFGRRRTDRNCILPSSIDFPPLKKARHRSQENVVSPAPRGTESHSHPALAG